MTNGSQPLPDHVISRNGLNEMRYSQYPLDDPRQRVGQVTRSAVDPPERLLVSARVLDASCRVKHRQLYRHEASRVGRKAQNPQRDGQSGRLRSSDVATDR